MSIAIGKVNEPDVIKLAELMQQKEILIRDMRNTVKRLNESQDLIIVVEVSRNGRDNPLRKNERLRESIESQSEWIIDRIYDTAIHNLENEIAALADKVMSNLIEANSRTITF
jgi:hypothetical protein